MFSSSVHLLPSLYYYEDVKKYYEETPPPRRKQWEPHQRPLDGPRKWHYRIEKHGEDEYRVCLYRTPVVTWHGPDKVTVDISYGSTLTIQFAWSYARMLGSPYKSGEFTVFEVDGIKWHAKESFVFELVDTPPGAPKRLRKYKLVSEHKKITRKVLDPDIAWEYRQASKEFKRWARGIWAVSGNDGSHPWENEAEERDILQKMLMEGWYPDNKDQWEGLIKAGIKLIPNRHTFKPTYGNANVEDVLKALDNHFQKDMYIRIPYDAPLPKRSK